MSQSDNWTAEDAAKAQSEGWDLFDTGEKFEIQRIDAPEHDCERCDAVGCVVCSYQGTICDAPRFSSDRDAVEFVKQQASNGDVVARKALRHDGKPNHECTFGPFERTHITGNVVRRCTHPGCRAWTMNGDESDEPEESDDEPQTHSGKFVSYEVCEVIEDAGDYLVEGLTLTDERKAQLHSEGLRSFFTLYGRTADGLATAIADYDDRAQAERIKSQIVG